MRRLAILGGTIALACAEAPLPGGDGVSARPDPSAPLDAGSAVSRDAGARDAGFEAKVDSGVPRDAGVSARDAGVPRRDAGSVETLDCSGLQAAGFTLCEANATECRIVFDDGAGCAAACAAGGLECAESYADAPGVCAPDSTMPALGCAETGHVSDYCVCKESGPPPPPAGCRPETFTPSRTESVNRTIVIDEAGVYDFNNVLHRWTGSGSCNQTENQPYILRIAASNVTVRNFYYENAPDGIHIGTANDGQGHSSGRPISNIVLENVIGRACEDALTTQYGVRQVTIRDSMFLPNANASYRDKLLQLNFGDVTVERTTFYGGGDSLCLMFKGGQNIVVRDSCFNDCDRALNGSTINGIVGRISTGRSDLLSERNEGNHPARARIFWDPWKFFTGEGNIHMTSVGDTINDNARTDMEAGATLTTR